MIAPIAPHRKGTSLWAFKKIKEDLIPSLIKDLKAVNATGFEDDDDECCNNIKRLLNDLVEVSTNIPEDNSEATTILVREIWEFLDDFRLEYIEWNDNSHTPEERQSRLSRMKEIRQSVKSKLTEKDSHRRSIGYREEFNELVDIERLQNIYNIAGEAVKSFPSYFHNLSLSVDNFNV